jgi:hypothetical protein
MSTPGPLADVRVFVAPRGNGFMRDIAIWIVESATQTGRRASLVDDGSLPDASGRIDLVVAPHEFFELSDHPIADLQRAAAASVCVCTEQPGTPWFHLSVDACRRGLVSLDINPHGVAALRAVGVDALHLRLGATPSIDVGATSTDRLHDVLFMGGLDQRRGAALADLAPRIHRLQSELRLFRFDRPITPATPGVLFGHEKYELLGSSRLLVNIHRDRSMHLPVGVEAPPYFEWARMIEAMANGCVVVTEPATEFGPLVAGTHFVEATLEQMPDAIGRLLAESASRDRIATEAHRFVTGPLALQHALGPLLDELQRRVLPAVAAHVATSRPTRGLWRLSASRVAPPVRLGPFRPHLELQRRAKRLALAESRALRQMDQLDCLLEHGAAQHTVRVPTPAHAQARPDVSVVVTVYNYAGVIAETLDSIVASEEIAFEVIVVDDHATDHSRQVIADFLDRHPDVPMMLVGKDANEGLAAARNTGFAEARAPLVMVMDADNAVYPLCLRRLADALGADPGAAAAYSILEDFGDRRDIRSALPWDVDRLCAANYIDAQAMWRRSSWEPLGGYRDDDDHVFGWEDWDLWLRLAASGGHATLVAQILGRYRVQSGSMIALTNLATDDAIDAMRARHASLPWQPRPV